MRILFLVVIYGDGYVGLLVLFRMLVIFSLFSVVDLTKQQVIFNSLRKVDVRCIAEMIFSPLVFKIN